FESPGPGSTHLMSPRLFALLRETVTGDPEAAAVDYHDWLDYVLARASGWRWHIDGEPTVEYRPHEGNGIGASVAARASPGRLRVVGSRWHRGQVERLTRVAARRAPTPARDRMLELVGDTGPRARLALARRAGQLRRRPRDRWIIG